MKTLTAFFTAILLTFAASAQQDKLQETLASDTILYQIYHHLPAGWTMSIDDSYITIYRLEKYALINSVCDSLNPDSLALYPRSETALICFFYEEKWDAERLFWTREANDSINLIMSSLPQQMGIAQLYDAEKSTRFNKVYTGKTKAEKEKVKSYYQRKSELKQHYTNIPNFNTSNFSLMQTDRTGIKKAGYCIYPEEANKEALNVYILFLNYCENPLE